MNAPTKPQLPPGMADLSINDVQSRYRWGMATNEQIRDYLRAWNAGPHFTQAVFVDGAIRNFDPDTGRYRHLWQEFGVRP